MIAKKLTDLIGKTPLLELGTYSAKRGIETATPKEIAEMTAKWEAENGRKDN